MDAIEFILKDSEKNSRVTSFARIVYLVGVFSLPLLLGLEMRESLAGAVDLRVFIPNLLACAFLVIPPLFFVRRKQAYFNFYWLLLALVISIFLSSSRVVFPLAERTHYLTREDFSRETLLCFKKGGYSAVMVGIWLSVFAFRIGSLPSRLWRMLLSLSAGLSSAVMLGFHCDSSSALHVLLGHILPGAVIGFCIFGVQEFLFVRGLQKKLPKLTQQIKNPSQLG